MNWIDNLKSVVIICFSSIFAFAVVELLYRAVNPEEHSRNNLNGTMLFEAGNNFLNHEGYFTYFPNREIRSLTLYSKPRPKGIEDIIIEYDYLIKTNNLGLVMQSDLSHEDRVVFIIGDSFTEGQGASPWFYDLENTYYASSRKLVNLGILGTGPTQWDNLAKSITEGLELQVDATVVNIIPGDMPRPVWSFGKQELKCLHHALCDYQFGFQGYNFNSEQNHENIKLSVLNSLIETSSIFDSIKKYVRKSRVVLDLYALFIKKWQNNENIPANESSLLALNNAVNGNFFVNVVSQKRINSTNFENFKIVKELIGFLEINDISYSWCDIPFDGFHTIDDHPNAEGYKILRECTENALNKVIK